MEHSDLLAEVIAFHEATIEKSAQLIDALTAAGRDTDDDMLFQQAIQLNNDAKRHLGEAFWLKGLTES